MTDNVRQRAYKCLLTQSGYVHPSDPAINFRKAYIVRDEIYLTEDAAEKATSETRPISSMEVITYNEAYFNTYSIN